MADLNANDIEAAMKTVEGTARSMGITVEKIDGQTEVERSTKSEMGPVAWTTRRRNMPHMARSI